MITYRISTVREGHHHGHVTSAGQLLSGTRLRHAIAQSLCSALGIRVAYCAGSNTGASPHDCSHFHIGIYAAHTATFGKNACKSKDQFVERGGSRYRLISILADTYGTCTVRE